MLEPFLCLIHWLKLPVQCWIKVERVDIFALFPFRRKTFSILPLRMISASDFFRLKQFPSISIFLCFFFFLSPNHEGVSVFQWLLLHIWRWSCFSFGFDLSDRVKYNDFQLLNQPYIPGINTLGYNLSFLYIAMFNLLTF